MTSPACSCATRPTSSWRKGFGATRGFGILLDGAGDDVYGPNVPGSEGRPHAFTQGSGAGRLAEAGDGRSFGGGFGVLVDAGGSDRYTCGSWCQGAGYWWGTGLLFDGAGDDRYRVDSYGLGAAAHHALGVALDRAGHDVYGDPSAGRPGGQLQAHARDGSLAAFVDWAGDDEYVHAGRSAGAADLQSVAFFWDRTGEDRYRRRPGGPFADDPSRGVAISPPTVLFENRLLKPPSVPTVGLFLDTGGEDRYPGRRRDDSAWHNGWARWERGLGLDVTIVWAPVEPGPADAPGQGPERF